MSAVMNAIKEVHIGEFCQTGSGGTPARAKARDYYGGTIPWVKSGELRESVITKTEETITEAGLRESAAKLLPPHTLLVALYGATVGRIGILGVEAATNQAVCYIIPDENRADRRYLYYALQSKVPDWLSQRVGGGQPNISQAIIRDTPIPLPPLSEQRRIADILDKADAIRRKRREARQVLRELVSVAFMHHFGDPVSNSRGWPIANMEDLFAISPNYGTMIKPSASTGEWLDLRVANIQNGELTLNDKKYVDLPEDVRARHEVQDGDLLLARAIGSLEHLGKCVIARPGNEKWAFDSHLMRVRFDKSLVDPVFVHAFLQSPGGRHEFLGNTRRSAVQFNINTKEFAKIRIPLPPVEIQRRFLLEQKALHNTDSKSIAATAAADGLFTSLVQRAFKGQL